MKISDSGIIRNRIFILVLAAALVTLLVTGWIGNKQDEAYRDNYHRYQQARQLVAAQQYPAAQEILAGLDTDTQASYQVLYLQARCAEGSGDYPAAAAYMQKAQETRPAFLQDQLFLYKYGAILYQVQDYESAGLYLQASLKYKQDKETTAQAQELLDKINPEYSGEVGLNE